MRTLTHKTTILLTPEEYRRLTQVARRCQTTMGEMVRRAIRKLYFAAPAAKHTKAWEKLFRLKAPVGTWEEMEQEIAAGRRDP